MQLYEILDTQFIVKDRFGINGSNWYIKFGKINGSKIRVIETGSKGGSSYNCSFEMKQGNIFITKPGESFYTWMISKTNGNLELWVDGQGGSMNFSMFECGEL